MVVVLVVVLVVMPPVADEQFVLTISTARSSLLFNDDDILSDLFPFNIISSLISGKKEKEDRKTLTLVNRRHECGSGARTLALLDNNSARRAIDTVVEISSSNVNKQLGGNERHW